MKVTDVDGRELHAGDMVTWTLGEGLSPQFLVQDLIPPGTTQKDAPGKITLSVEIMIPPVEFENNSVRLSDIMRSDATQRHEPTSPTAPTAPSESLSLAPILQMIIGTSADGQSNSPQDPPKELSDSHSKELDEAKRRTLEGDWVN